jgi:hypothetical protein
MNTTNSATRYITRKDCPCGAGRTSALSAFHGDTATCFGDLCVACRGCGRNRGAQSVRGKVSTKHACGAKCLTSTGPSCECSCGGKNHGGGYDANGVA